MDEYTNSHVTILLIDLSNSHQIQISITTNMLKPKQDSHQSYTPKCLMSGPKSPLNLTIIDNELKPYCWGNMLNFDLVHNIIGWEEDESNINRDVEVDIQ